MLKVLTMSSEKTMSKFFTLLSVVAFFAAKLSANGCSLFSLEQPKIPRSLIKED